MIKKVIAVFFIAFSIISCSTEENENLKKSVNSDEKKQEILNQFNELGLDPEKVSFVDTLNSSNAIKVNSIEELQKHITEIKATKEQLNYQFSTLESFDSLKETSKSPYFFDYGEDHYRSYDDGLAKLPSSLRTDIYFGFSYNTHKIKYRLYDGIRNVYSGLRGLTFGISYSQDGVNADKYRYDLSPNTHIIEIFGVVHYNILIEGLGTVYSERVLTTIRFTPPSGRYSYQLQYIFAFARFY